MLIHFAAALSLLLAPGAAAQPAAPPLSQDLPPALVEARVEAYLSAFDHVVEPDAWRALGPGAAPQLARIAADPASLPTRRAQAAWGLAHLAPAAAPALVLLAGREDSPLVLRLAAVRALGATLADGELEGTLLPLVERPPDVRVRAVAAQALVTRRPGRSCQRVASLVEAEPSERRPAFAGAMALCAEAPRGAERRPAARAP